MLFRSLSAARTACCTQDFLASAILLILLNLFTAMISAQHSIRIVSPRNTSNPSPFPSPCPYRLCDVPFINGAFGQQDTKARFEDAARLASFPQGKLILLQLHLNPKNYPSNLDKIHVKLHDVFHITYFFHLFSCIPTQRTFL